MTFRLLVTGSRNFTDAEYIEMRLDLVTQCSDNVTLIEGGANGADRLAREWAEKRGHEVETYPAYWKKYGKAAGPIRNQQMVDSSPDFCVAFILGDSVGTRDCALRAKKAGIPRKVYVYPNYLERNVSE